LKKHLYEKTIDNPNLFRIIEVNCEEDRLTMAWEYVLNTVDGLGQLLVDYIFETSELQNKGLEKGIFQEAIDQSRFKFRKNSGFLENKPDMVINCKNYMLVCEHKLESPEGYNQIFRYCTELDHKDMPIFVLLVSTDPDSLKSKLKENYLRPRNKLKLNYQWEDFYPIVNRFRDNNKTARNFSQFMKSKNLYPSEFDGWPNPFNNSPGKDIYKKLLTSLNSYIKEELNPSKIQPDPSKLGIQIQKPKNLPIRILHLFLFKPIGHCNHKLIESGLFLEIKSKIGDEKENRQIELKSINESFSTDIGEISVITPDTIKSISNSYRIMREYAIDLQNILPNNDFNTAKDKVKTFFEESLNHLINSI
jgi:hypothetical protein